jgi:hypothetical protein
MDSSRPAPTQIAPDTFVVHDVIGDGHNGQVPCNVLVIRGAEPVVVDTGVAEHGAELLADIFALVEPADLRWVMVSHADADHAGNLDALVAAAPQVTVLAGAATHAAGPAGWARPRRRCVVDGERVLAGDRRLLVVAPPVFDAAPTLGLYDTATGVWWAVDALATPVPAALPEVGELGEHAWRAGVVATARRLAPWLGLVDDRRFGAAIDRVAGLGPAVIAGAHTPPIGHHHVPTALSILGDLGR